MVQIFLQSDLDPGLQIMVIGVPSADEFLDIHCADAVPTIKSSNRFAHPSGGSRNFTGADDSVPTGRIAIRNCAFKRPLSHDSAGDERG